MYLRSNLQKSDGNYYGENCHRPGMNEGIYKEVNDFMDKLVKTDKENTRDQNVTAKALT